MAPVGIVVKRVEQPSSEIHAFLVSLKLMIVTDSRVEEAVELFDFLMTGGMYRIF